MSTETVLYQMLHAPVLLLLCGGDAVMLQLYYLPLLDYSHQHGNESFMHLKKVLVECWKETKKNQQKIKVLWNQEKEG